MFPFSYLLSQSSTPSPTPDSHSPPPTASTSNLNSLNRFPAPTSSHHALLPTSSSSQTESITTGGRKRERSAHHPIDSLEAIDSISAANNNNNNNNNSNGNLEPFDNQIGRERMEGYGLDAVQLAAHFEEEANRAVKKRKKGIASTLVEHTLTTIIYGGVLSLAIPYTAYQLWKNPSAFLDGSSNDDELLSSDSPPPYSQLPRNDQTPSQIPCRVRHAHPPRPRPPSRKSSPEISLSSPLPPSLTTTNYDFHTPRVSHPIPQFLPLERSFSDSDLPEMEGGEGREETEMDEEMLAMGERLKSLIDSGREALLYKASTERVTSRLSSSVLNGSNGHSTRSHNKHHRHSIASTSSNSHFTPTSHHNSGSTRRHSTRYDNDFHIDSTSKGSSRKDSVRNSSGRLSPTKVDRSPEMGREMNGQDLFGEILGRESGKGWWEK